jgi:hypothetical protein
MAVVVVAAASVVAVLVVVLGEEEEEEGWQWEVEENRKRGGGRREEVPIINFIQQQNFKHFSYSTTYFLLPKTTQPLQPLLCVLMLSHQYCNMTKYKMIIKN